MPTPNASIARRAGQARSFARFLTGLPSYLRVPLSTEECLARIRHRLEQRDTSFLTLVRRGIVENGTSPYRPLLRHAGVEFGDVEALVRKDGVESALSALYEAGVYVRLDEFKGRSPIARTGLSYDVADAQFDNPLLDPVYGSRTGGSTGAARVVHLDFANMEHGVPHTALFLEMHGVAGRPLVLWRPVPPGGAGLHNLLDFNKLGLPVDRWFTQTWPDRTVMGVAERAILRYAVFASRRWAAGIGGVERAVPEQAVDVAARLGELVRAGTPPHLGAPAGSAVRVARAALEAGIDISGTMMRTGGEPLTAAKVAVIRDAGCTVVTNYSMAEVGRIGIGCADGDHIDDVHVVTDHIALLQRDDARSPGRPGAGALWLTTLNPACRKVMLNVEVGDHATMAARACGCRAGALGLTTHLHGIRSHDKLTSEGMNFLAADVVTLVEETLPRRFGGGVGDYQLVEREENGVSTISVVVHPRVGVVDEGELVDRVLASLREGASFRRMMTSVLESAGSVRVVRAEPFVTTGAKTPAVHIVRS